MKNHALRCLLSLLLTTAIWPAAFAVVPYRAPQDEDPSLAARSHLAACRLHAHGFLAAQAASNGFIENESYVQRGSHEYFRFLLRSGANETVLICDARSGQIRRTLNVWDGL